MFSAPSRNSTNENTPKMHLKNLLNATQCNMGVYDKVLPF